MHRRALLATPLLAPALTATKAAAQAPSLVTEEFMVPAKDAGIEIFVRNKRPETLNAFAPARTLLFVHGTAYPASTTFDLPLGGLSWMDYIAGRGFDVWCMDVRGYGRSTRPAEMAQPPEASQPVAPGDVGQRDIAAVSAFIRERRRVPKHIVMGWSWGATQMGRFAADNAGWVERAVLYAPAWIRPGLSAIDDGKPLGAYRLLRQATARQVWLNQAPEDKRAALIPPGWFEHFVGLTWATDPEGLRMNPPALRVPNGPFQDGREYWSAGKPYWDPAKVVAPTLLVVGEWDRLNPPEYSATIFPLLTSSPGKRLVMLAEGTHQMMLERNRGALFQAVQVFLEEAAA